MNYQYTKSFLNNLVHHNYIKLLSYFSYFITIIALSVGTFIEHFYGTEISRTFIYGHVWFAVLLAVVAVSGFLVLLQYKSYSRPAVFGIHIAFILILLGAFATRVSSLNGTVHLRYGDSISRMMNEGTENQIKPEFISLPFVVKLDTFIVTYYPGTNAPSDYITKFKIIDTNTALEEYAEVSMNNIFSYKGYRFYQASYDSDFTGTWLSVYYDTWGLPITYCGYFLLFSSLLLWLLSRKNDFMKLLKHPLLRKVTILIFLVFISGISFGQVSDNQQDTLKTLTKEQQKIFSKLLVEFNHQPEPIEKLANDFTLKILGKTMYRDFSSLEFFAGWIFYPDSWRNEAIFEIKNEQFRDIFDMPSKASWNDFYVGDDHQYFLEEYWHVIHQAGKKSGFIAEAERLNEQVQIINMLTSGNLLKLYPVPDKDRVLWYSPRNTNLPAGTDQGLKIFIERGFDYIYTAAITHDDEEFNLLINILSKYQNKYIKNSRWSKIRIKLNHLYTSIPFSKLLYMFNLSLGVLLLILTIFLVVSQKRFSLVEIGAKIFLLISFSATGFTLVLLGIAAGHWPMSNGSETMLMLSWCILLLTLLLRNRVFLLIPFGFLLSGFTQLVSVISMKSPQLTPMMPVLSSPLLSIHVSCMMISYALASFTFLNAISAIIISFFSKRRRSSHNLEQALNLISKILLHPLIVFMGLGIFIGAIWGNQSWGRYWGWDPKEVWALINLLVYAVLLHKKMFKFMSNSLKFNLYLIFAFLTIVMTYLGVNYFLGGIHSYA